MPLKCIAQALAVSVPEHTTGEDAADGAPHHAAQHEGSRQVEPYDRVGARPDEVAHLLVVAVDHPAWFSDEDADTPSELHDVELGPPRLVEDGVELGARDLQPLRQLPRQQGLARA